MRKLLLCVSVAAIVLQPRLAAAEELVGVFTINYRDNAGGCSYASPNPYFCSYIAPGPIHIPAAPGRYRLVFPNGTPSGAASDAWTGDAAGGTFIELGITGADFDHAFGDITLYFNDWVPFDNPPYENVVALYRVTAPDCHLRLEYSAGTLTMTFGLLTAEPVTWRTWLVAQGTVYPLWSAPLPQGVGPLSFPLMVPGIPAIGKIGVLTAFTTTQGITCSSWKVVDTSATALMALSSRPR